VGYSRLPAASNDDGFVGIQIKKKEPEVHQQQQNLVSELQKCFGNKPTIMVCVDGLKPLPDDRYMTMMFLKPGQTATNPHTKVID
jgi:nuclear pore complex protein Nup54